MSKYTTELRYFETQYFLAMQNYPIINEEYRTQLNTKIFNHFYFHEIGFETPAKFNHYLASTMNDIMPLYNQYIQSELISINPSLSFERKTTSNKNMDNKVNQSINNNTSLDNITTSATDEIQTKNTDITQNNNISSDKKVDGDNSSVDTDIFYDTPNGSLGDITDSTYATTVNKKTGSNIIDENEILNSSENVIKDENAVNVIDSNSENKTNTDTSSNTANETNTNSIETNIITENGFEVSLSELLLKYRETFLNIDKQIIEELRDLFLMIY